MVVEERKRISKIRNVGIREVDFSSSSHQYEKCNCKDKIIRVKDRVRSDSIGCANINLVGWCSSVTENEH